MIGSTIVLYLCIGRGLWLNVLKTESSVDRNLVGFERDMRPKRKLYRVSGGVEMSGRGQYIRKKRKKNNNNKTIIIISNNNIYIK